MLYCGNCHRQPKLFRVPCDGYGSVPDWNADLDKCYIKYAKDNLFCRFAVHQSFKVCAPVVMIW